MNFARGKIPSWGKSRRKCIYSVPAQETAKHRCKVWFASGERHRCNNEGKTRNSLKFDGVPQTNKPISAVSGPKFAILWGTCGGDIAVEQVFFPIVDARLSCEDTLIQPNKVVRWCPDGEFLAIFASSIFREPHAAHFRPAF